MPDPGWWEALWPDPAKVLRDVGVTPSMDVVDLCSRDGWFTFPLSKIARHVIAIDIDGKLLDAAKVRFDERGGAPNVTLVEADAYDLGKHVQTPVDHVFLANAFHGVANKTRLAQAVHDILKPNGLFAIVSWYARPREETTVLGQPMTVFMVDDRFDLRFLELRKETFKDNFPASALINIHSLVPPYAMIEIQCVAVIA